MRIAKEYSISGHVQGVGFRWTAKRIADGMDVAGWVRNNRDGSVSLAIEGEEAEVNSFLQRLDQAMGAHIRSMRAEDVEPGKNRNGFDVVR